MQNSNKGQKLEVKGDRVFIEAHSRAASSSKSAAGLHVVEPSKQGAPNTGIVFAVGSDVKRVKVGQEVVFDEQHPKGIKWEGRKIIPVHEDQIVAVING